MLIAEHAGSGPAGRAGGSLVKPERSITRPPRGGCRSGVQSGRAWSRDILLMNVTDPKPEEIFNIFMKSYESYKYR